MNVKFKKFERKNGSIYFYAILLRSVRHPVTRKPQNIYLAQIQTVAEKDLTSAVTRLGFWYRLESIMAKLSLTETDKSRARQSASRKILPPAPLALGVA